MITHDGNQVQSFQAEHETNMIYPNQLMIPGSECLYLQINLSFFCSMQYHDNPQIHIEIYFASSIILSLFYSQLMLSMHLFSQ